MGHRRVRSGLTLLELLIALTLLVLVLSLSVPSVLTNLDRRQFNEMREQVLTYMTLVRAEAQLHGEVLAVYYQPPRRPDDAFLSWEDPIGFGGLTPGDVESLPAPGNADAVGAGRERPARLVARPYELFADPSSRSTMTARTPGDPYGRGYESRAIQRATLRFTEAFRMSTSLPVDWLEATGFDEEAYAEMALAVDEAGASMATAASSDTAAAADEEPLILVVFFPDGTAVTPGDRVYLVHEEDNVAELVINRWTGQAELRVLANELEEEEPEALDEEAYDPFDPDNIMPAQPAGAPGSTPPAGGDLEGGAG